MATTMNQEEIDETLNAFANKVAVPLPSIRAEFEQKLALYKGNANTAIHALKGSYKASLRSNAKMVTGVFIAMTSKQNQNYRNYPDAMEMIEKYQATYNDNWMFEALEKKIIDKDGNPVFTAENCGKATFKIGQEIKEFDWQRRAYGIFKIGDTTKVGVVYINDVDGFYPEFGVEYMFKGSCNKLENPMYSITATKVFNPVVTGNVITFDEISTLLEENYIDNCAAFENVYDFDNEVLNIVDTINPKFIISLGIVTELKFTTWDSDNVVITPLSDFDDVVQMKMDKKMTSQLMEGASGIVIYKPYFRTDKNVDGKLPSGEMLGFIPEDHFRMATPNDPAETEVVMEFE